MSVQHVVHAAHDLRDLVLHALDRSPYVRGGRFDVEVDDDRVRITGRVGSWFEKQMVQESARRVPGVTRIVNDACVVSTVNDACVVSTVNDACVDPA